MAEAAEHKVEARSEARAQVQAPKRMKVVANTFNADGVPGTTSSHWGVAFTVREDGMLIAELPIEEAEAMIEADRVTPFDERVHTLKKKEVKAFSELRQARSANVSGRTRTEAIGRGEPGSREAAGGNEDE